MQHNRLFSLRGQSLPLCFQQPVVVRSHKSGLLLIHLLYGQHIAAEGVGRVCLPQRGFLMNARRPAASSPPMLP